jgi:hypothetical protein
MRRKIIEWILLFATLGVVLLVSIPSQAAPKLGKTWDYREHPIIGTSTRETSHGFNCQFDDMNGGRWRLRVCNGVRHHGKWFPSLISPYGAGGLEKGRSTVIGTWQLRDTFTRTNWVPWEVKMLVTNESTINTSQPSDHKAVEFYCGPLDPCTRSSGELHSRIRGFVWDYLFPPFGGCGPFETYSDVGVAVWPRKPVYGGNNTILGVSPKGITLGTVCSGI